jgi:hypothetical protein
VILTGVFMISRVRTIFFPRNPYLFSDMTWGLMYVRHALAWRLPFSPWSTSWNIADGRLGWSSDLARGKPGAQAGYEPLVKPPLL